MLVVSGSLSRETGLEEALEALLKASRSPSLSPSLIFMLEVDGCLGFDCPWRKGSTPRGFLNPVSITAFRVGLDAEVVDREGFVRDLTVPLGAGLERMLEVEACFFNAGAELDVLGRGRREILVGIADDLAVDDVVIVGRVNWDTGQSIACRRVYLVRALERSF